jgi:Carboxypeptidase regulatory-like domain/TonB dependent receptor-like, beta-barrel
MVFRRDRRNALVNLLALSALALSLLISGRLQAQVAGATLSGTLTDASGALIPNGQISIKNLATGVTRSVTADAAGFYSAPNLLPGTYEVTVTAPGFASQVQSGIVLTVGAQQELNFTLRVGQVTEKVEVTGEAPAVQLASSSVSAVVASNTVVELPLNGRDWGQLAALQSGVSVLQTQLPTGATAPLGNRGFGRQLAISGTRPQQNNYRVDGISVVDYSGGSPGSVLGLTLGVDAIGEFSVLTSNYSAEYGRTSGGVVNAITRSGTNQFHGEAYWFIRDEGFDARNFFDQTIAPFHRNQFGASAGGPIQKDKTFFFANYEGFRQALGITNVNNVPSADIRNGIFHNDDGTTSPITIDPAVKPYLALWPLPNAGLNGVGNTGKFIIATNATGRENFVTTRLNRKFSEKDSLSGTFFYDKGYNGQPDQLDTVLNANTSLRMMITAEETHIFSPSLVNSLRLGYSRIHPTQNVPISAVNPLAADTALGALPGRPAPAITVPGLRTFLGGLGEASINDQPWNSYQLYDDAFLTKGAHSLKFGLAIENMRHSPQNAAYKNGSFFFGGLTGFLENQPLSVRGPGFFRPGLRQTLFGGYIQDDWRFRPSLTLNLGLRYEATTVVSEEHNRLSNLRHLTDTTLVLGTPYQRNPTLKNFEPRIGFAWDPFHNGKTAVRGAFGVFDALPLISEYFTAAAGFPPFNKVITVAGLAHGDFPGVLNSIISSGTSKEGQFRQFEFNPPRNYVMIWNLNIQHQLTPSTTLTLGYVGNHGVHMLNLADDANDVLPVSNSNGLLWPFPAGHGTVISPSIPNVEIAYWGGDATYDALQVTLAKKFSHGFQAQGSYTWGKNLDTGSATGIPDPYTNSISSLFWFCKTCRRGFSDFNVSQTLTINYIWDVPTPKAWGGAASHVLGGWELGGIISTHTGVPITPLIGGDPLGLNNTDPFAFPDRLNTPGCANPVNPGNPNNYVKLNCFAVPMATPAIAAQCTPYSAVPGSCANLMGNAGRNTVIGPGLVNFDFSLFKNNYIRRISENFNVQFRAEFFNIFNRANFDTPFDNQTLFNPDGTVADGAGAVDQTATTSRQIQFGLKIIW